MLLPAVLFLFCLLIGDVIPVFSSIVGQFDCPLLSGARGVGGDHLSRFAARSLRPGEFALASVTSSIVPNVIRVYPPSCRSRRRLLSLLLFTCGAVTFRPLVRNLIPASMSVVRHVMPPCMSIRSDSIRRFLQKITLPLAYIRKMLCLCTRFTISERQSNDSQTTVKRQSRLTLRPCRPGKAPQIYL